jgi:very-short-patch-repair endonuclease
VDSLHLTFNRQGYYSREMRFQITKKSSTIHERIVYEVLKEFHVPFKHRWIIGGREVDFLIFDNICLEIDGHDQDTVKNELLAKLGYVPIHLNNNEVNRESIINLIKNYAFYKLS